MNQRRACLNKFGLNFEMPAAKPDRSKWISTRTLAEQVRIQCDGSQLGLVTLLESAGFKSAATPGRGRCVGWGTGLQVPDVPTPAAISSPSLPRATRSPSARHPPQPLAQPLFLLAGDTSLCSEVSKASLWRAATALDCNCAARSRAAKAPSRFRWAFRCLAWHARGPGRPWILHRRGPLGHKRLDRHADMTSGNRNANAKHPKPEAALGALFLASAQKTPRELTSSVCGSTPSRYRSGTQQIISIPITL